MARRMVANTKTNQAVLRKMPRRGDPTNTETRDPEMFEMMGKFQRNEVTAAEFEAFVKARMGG